MKSLFVFFTVVIFTSEIFAQKVQGAVDARASAAAPSPGSTFAFCQPITNEQVAKHVGDCPILAVDDFDKEKTKCDAEEKSKSEDCKKAEADIQAIMNDLQASYNTFRERQEQQRRQQQAAASAAANGNSSASAQDISEFSNTSKKTTDSPSVSASSSETQSSSSTADLVQINNQLNRALLALEQVKRGNACGGKSFLYSLLPFVSLINPSIAYIGGAAMGLFTRFQNLVGNDNTIAMKLAV